MKCKVCGCELDPNKRYCDKCGNFVNDAKPAGDGEFSWNTIDFPKPKKMQDIEMNWNGEKKSDDPYMTPDASEGFVPHAGKSEAAPEKRPAVQPAPQAVAQQQPAPQPTPAPVQPQMQQAPYAAPQFAWTMPSSAWTIPPQQPVVVPQPYNVAMPQPISTVAPAVSPMPQMPAGYTAPPLYMTQPLPVVQQPVVVAPTLQTIPGVPVQTIPGVPVQTVPSATMPGVTLPQQPTYEPVNVDKWLDEQLKDENITPKDEQFFTFYKKNKDFQKLLDEEYERYKSKYDTNATSLNLEIAKALKAQQAPVEAKAFKEESPASDRTMVYDGNAPKHAYNPVKESKDSGIFDGEPITDFEKMIMEGTKNSEEIGESTLAISNEALKKEIDEVAAKVEAAYNPYKYKEYDESKSQQDLAKMAAAREAFFKPETKEDLDRTSAIEIKSIFDEWDKERKEDSVKENSRKSKSNKEKKSKKDKKKKKGGFGKFILILLLLLALFAIADVAAVTVIPDHPVSEFFYMVNDKVFEGYNFVLEKLGLAEAKEDEPEAALTAQEQAAKDVNTHIEKITCDSESSKFNQQGVYGYTNLGAMSVVTDEATIKAVTQLLVKYNCAWIDYVNSGSDITCFDYLKADGEAFRAASNFDSVGKITETFKKLNIGEIRKDASNVYVFADELISVKKGNEITEVPSKLIYKLELIGDAYKIVEYSAYN